MEVWRFRTPDTLLMYTRVPGKSRRATIPTFGLVFPRQTARSAGIGVHRCRTATDSNGQQNGQQPSQLRHTNFHRASTVTIRERFRPYRRPYESELRELWRTCLFTFDTSSLLNVYRFHPDAARDFPSSAASGHIIASAGSLRNLLVSTEHR